MPGMFAPPQKPMPDTVQQSVERGKAISKGVRMAGEALRTAFGGGAITGESADRRTPTEQMTIGNPMAHPMAACLLYTSPSPRDLSTSRMPSSA